MIVKFYEKFPDGGQRLVDRIHLYEDEPLDITEYAREYMVAHGVRCMRVITRENQRRCKFDFKIADGRIIYAGRH